MKGRVRVVGFDCAEDEHVAVLLDEEGAFEKRVRVVNRRDLVQEALAGLMLRVGPEAQLVVVVESKRSHGRVVSDVAQQLGCEVWQVNTVVQSARPAINVITAAAPQRGGAASEE